MLMFFHNLPDASINHLECVQNSLVRAVFPSFKRSDHITPALLKLHWLPIKQRIHFKIASITYKTIQNSQPYYLFELLYPYKPSRSLRSSTSNLLQIPFKTEQGRRSFSFAASTIWNKLPFSSHCSFLIFLSFSTKNFSFKIPLLSSLTFLFFPDEFHGKWTGLCWTFSWSHLLHPIV